MNKQDVYEEVRAHFAQPGAQLSKNDMGACYYRHPVDQRACAVGALLTDEEHAALLEETNRTDEMTSGDDIGLNVEYLAKMEAFPPRLKEVDTNFLSDVQKAHDNAKDVSSFLEALDHLAYGYKLRVRRAG